MMTDTMKQIFGMNVIEPGLKILRRPNECSLEQCQEFGMRIAEKTK
jgi:flavorubredoxin